MKRNRIKLQLQAGILGGALFLAGISANATPSLFINFDENGNIAGNTAGHFIGPNGPPIYIGLNTDNSLNYSTETPNGMSISGFVFIYDDAQQTVLSDVLQFFPYGQQYIYVYSDLGETGDSGFPSTLLAQLQNPDANIFNVTEMLLPGGGDGLVYTPTPNQPGYGANITFTFTSDPVSDLTVPDGGSSALLLGMGVMALAGFRRMFNCITV